MISNIPTTIALAGAVVFSTPTIEPNAIAACRVVNGVTECVEPRGGPPLTIPRPKVRSLFDRSDLYAGASPARPQPKTTPKPYTPKPNPPPRCTGRGCPFTTKTAELNYHGFVQSRIVNGYQTVDRSFFAAGSAPIVLG